MSKIIIGLGHYSRTGKDTLANDLILEFARRGLKASKRSFAASVKETTHLVYGWAGVQEGDYYEEFPEARNFKLKQLANKNWPEGPTVVDLWIEIGMNFRGIFDNTWIRNTLDEPFQDVLIIPDTRFPNEVQAIKDMGGYLIKVEKPGVGPRPGSKADAALLGFTGWDYLVDNDGDFWDLSRKASTLATSILSDKETRIRLAAGEVS